MSGSCIQALQQHLNPTQQGKDMAVYGGGEGVEELRNFYGGTDEEVLSHTGYYSGGTQCSREGWALPELWVVRDERAPVRSQPPGGGGGAPVPASHPPAASAPGLPPASPPPAQVTDAIEIFEIVRHLSLRLVKLVFEDVQPL